MHRIGIVDYESGTDINKIPLGHINKVLEEYIALIKDEFSSCIIASESVVKSIDNGVLMQSEYIVLPYENVLKITKKIIYKIKLKMKSLMNIRAVFMQDKCDILWFINVTYLLYLYLFFCGKRNKKIICTMYRQNFSDEKFGCIINFFYKRALKKVDLIISSCNSFSFSHNNVFFMPDYYYQEKYTQYVPKEKEEKIVCVGTIDRRKKIMDILPKLNRLQYPVVIVGDFIDNAYYSEVKAAAGADITVINQHLSYKEYCTYLGKAKYCILPYDKRRYKSRTSGVLIESMFLNTVPIADKRLLEFNDIKGIDIDLLDTYRAEELKNQDLSSFYEQYLKKKISSYNFVVIRNQLIDKVREIC